MKNGIASRVVRQTTISTKSLFYLFEPSNLPTYIYITKRIHNLHSCLLYFDINLAYTLVLSWADWDQAYEANRKTTETLERHSEMNYMKNRYRSLHMFRGLGCFLKPRRVQYWGQCHILNLRRF